MRKIISILIIFSLFISVTPSTLSDDEDTTTWLSDFRYRVAHNITGSTSGNLTNYNVKININPGAGNTTNDNLYLGGKTNTNLSDIRVTGDDGTTLLDYWLDPGIDKLQEWNKYQGNPILSPIIGENNKACWGSVVKNGSAYYMYYMYDAGAYNAIGLANSTDKVTWTRYSGNPVLTVGGGGTWDSNDVWVPMVWIESGTWHMIYTGRNVTSVNAVGLANSTDGMTWTKCVDNPVITGDVGEWDEDDCESYGVMKVNDTYYLWYNTLNVLSNRLAGLATSTNLVNWTKDENNPIFDTPSRFCLFPLKYESYYYLLVPRFVIATTSDYTYIDVYRDTNPTFYDGEREFIGTSINIGPWADGAWDYRDQDTACILTNDIYRNSFPDNELYCYYSGNDNSKWQTGLTINTNVTTALIPRNNTALWIKIPSILTYPNETKIYIYYGNEDAESLSNGTDTFLFFDDFNRVALGSNWTDSGGTWTIENGRLKGSDAGYRYCYYDEVKYSNVSIECKIESGVNIQIVGHTLRFTDTSNFYHTRLKVQTPSQEWYDTIGGAPSRIDLAYGNLLVKDWNYTLRSDIYDTGETETTIKSYVDGVQRMNDTQDPMSHITGYFGVMLAVNTNYYDDFFIRDRVDPEPLNGEWEDEQDSYVPPTPPEETPTDQINALIPIIIAATSLIVVVSILSNGIIKPFSRIFRRTT